MRRSRLLGSLVVALLAMGAMYCGGSTEETSVDAGTSGKTDGGTRDAGTNNNNNNGNDAGNNNTNPDAGNNNQPDAGNNNQPDAGNNNQPDAGNNNQPDGGNTTTDPLLRACGTPSNSIGANITVTIGSTTIDFSNASFSIGYEDEDPQEGIPAYVWASWMVTDADGVEHYLDAWVDSPYSDACPASFTLPDVPNFAVGVNVYGFDPDLFDYTYDAYSVPIEDGPSTSGTLVLDHFDGRNGSRAFSFSCTNCVFPDDVGGPDVTINGDAYGKE